jgi:hypothetical protein
LQCERPNTEDALPTDLKPAGHVATELAHRSPRSRHLEVADDRRHRL